MLDHSCCRCQLCSGQSRRQGLHAHCSLCLLVQHSFLIRACLSDFSCSQTCSKVEIPYSSLRKLREPHLEHACSGAANASTNPSHSSVQVQGFESLCCLRDRCRRRQPLHTGLPIHSPTLDPPTSHKRYYYLFGSTRSSCLKCLLIRQAPPGDLPKP